MVLARAYSFMKKTGCTLPAAHWATRAGNVFTTHTPVEAGFDRFDRSLVDKYAGFYADMLGLSRLDLMALGGGRAEDEYCPFTMAHLALNGCSHVNGVSRLHGRVSRKIFQPHFARWPELEVPVGYVTNGVHIPTWDSPAAHSLWTQAYPGTCGPEDIDYLKEGISRLGDSKLWCFKAEARRDLVEYVRHRHFRQLQERGAEQEELKLARHVSDPNTITLGFARRATAYKRTNLLLKNPERLIAILTDKAHPVQLVMAAKAHPSDEELRFGKLTMTEAGDFWCFSVEAYLGELQPGDVRVELYADPLPEAGEESVPEKIVMERQQPLKGAVNGFIYGARVPTRRQAEDFTPRMVPYRAEAFIPMEESHILWMR